MSTEQEQQQQSIQLESRFLGKTGLRVSELSFGTWVTAGDQVDYERMRDCVVAAYESGIYFFDTAEVYADGEAEVVLGNILKEKGWPREDLVISTKIIKGGNGPNSLGLSRKHVIEGTKASLRRLQLDYVDIIFAHRPDPATPMEEVVRAFNFVIEQGWAFYWGTSEWTAQEIQEAVMIAKTLNLVAPVVEQPQYSMLFRSKVEVEFDRLYRGEYGLGLTTWSPLRFGILTGKYNDGIPEDSRLNMEKFAETRTELTSEKGQAQIAKVRLLTEIANELQCTPAQLAIAWCLRNNNVSSVILGASNPNQVIENVKSVTIVPLITDDINERIENILENKEEPKTYFGRSPH
eukprot:TRINITY_DN10690_c0_g1_i1.p1 TRINITY_DN10690_c0_g1~~TRINITY_DN10690_c0_g1_i1.p1  ORF type:complete len:361 (+),score=84.20 TRINITY_DN10690_c0_g1_i1:38-1084(+)